MLCKPLNKTMNNLRLWGYDRYQTHDIQQSRAVNTGLIEKLNQLKTNIQELTLKLQNKTNNEDISSLELILKKVQEEALGARASALQAQEAINEINNKDEGVDALVAHSNTITTNLQQTQQQIKTKLNGHLENYETLQQNLAEISSNIENIGTADRASATQAHENIMKNLNLSIKRFQEYKEETISQHQNLMRRAGECYAERHLHKHTVLQIWSKSTNLRKNRKIILMNNEVFYQFPINYKLTKIKIYSSSNFISSQPLKYTIHLE